MKIYYAIVSHSYGENVYLGFSSEDVDQQVAQFIQEQIGDVSSKDTRDYIIMCLNENLNDLAIQEYFGAQERESFSRGEADLPIEPWRWVVITDETGDTCPFGQYRETTDEATAKALARPVPGVKAYQLFIKPD